MSRTLLIHRAVALHRPRQTPLSFRPFSTSKPSKGDKEKQQVAIKNETPGSSMAPIKKKRGRPPKKVEGPPLLIPPGTKQSSASIPRTPFDRSKASFFVHDMTAVNVSPLLETRNYCKRSAFYLGTPTLDGNKAMQRLLKGKKQLLDELHKDIVQSTRGKNQRNNKTPRSYVAVGHGVPKQLFQTNVDFCDFLLKKYNDAAEISFKSLDSLLDFETMRVCPSPENRNGDEPRLEPWPFEQYSQEQYQMDLYLAEMNRFCNGLCPVLWHNYAALPPTTTDDSLQDDDDDDDFVVSSSPSSTRLHHWKVDLVRGCSDYAMDSFLAPIVEWTLPENRNANSSIVIRLRGQPSRSSSSTKKNRRRKAPLEVTMIFRATFENPFKQD